jgi:hypothetical protein
MVDVIEAVSCDGELVSCFSSAMSTPIRTDLRFTFVFSLKPLSVLAGNWRIDNRNSRHQEMTSSMHRD